MSAFRLYFLSLLVLLASAPRAMAETWTTTTSSGGVHFAVHLHQPRMVRKVPLVDGVRWDLTVSNRARNHVLKVLPKGPLGSVTIDQKGHYARVIARWRFPFNLTPRLTGDRLELVIPHVINRTNIVDMGSGLRFERLNRWTPAGPISANIVRADLRRYSLRPQLARSGRGFTTEPVSAMARRAHALAAVNGSFFSPKVGSPIGLLMLDGQIVSSSYFNRSVFGVRYDGTCFINNAKLRAAIRLSDDRIFIMSAVNRPTMRNQSILYTPHWGLRTRSVSDPSRREFVIGADGTILSVTTGNATIPSDGYVVSGQGTALEALEEHFKVGTRAIVYSQLSNEWEGVKYAIGGGPTLVSDAEVKVTARQERFGAEIASGRAPRTAVGYLGGTSVLMVTVDGRQKHSIGMTLYEMARLMRELGAQDAINLDGGGSTAMVVRGKLVNRPSDGVERSVNNALVLVSAGS